jgi:hypothetical protein
MPSNGQEFSADRTRRPPTTSEFLHPTGQGQVVDNLTGDGGRQLLQAGRTVRRSPAGQVGDAARSLPAIARCRRCGRHGLGEGPAGPGSTARSPDEGGGGLALAEPLPAAEPSSRHRRALLGQCRPSSAPWPATAGPAPPPAARCRAPDTAGRRGCGTVARGYGMPGSASRRSAECTDGVVGLVPASAAAGLVQPDPAVRLISPGRRVFRRITRCHRPWPGCAGLRPTHQAGGHGPAGAALHIHGTPRRWGLPSTVWVRGGPKA